MNRIIFFVLGYTAVQPTTNDRNLKSQKKTNLNYQTRLKRAQRYTRGYITGTLLFSSLDRTGLLIYTYKVGLKKKG